MRHRRSRYINLKDSLSSKADNAEKKYRLYSPSVQLDGPKGGMLWKGSKGIFLQQRSGTESAPQISFSSILKALVYGISFLVFAIGFLFKQSGSRGQFNGGQA